jgi:hypothetical protein
VKTASGQSRRIPDVRVSSADPSVAEDLVRRSELTFVPEADMLSIARGAPSQSRSGRSTSLTEKLIKIGAKLASHGRYVAFQMAEVAVPKMLFAEILRLIAELRPPPDAAPA